MSIDTHHPIFPPAELLEEHDGFYLAGRDIDQLDDPHEAQDTPVLEQLGPPTFRRSNFPLLGFLATVYEQVAGHMNGGHKT